MIRIRNYENYGYEKQVYYLKMRKIKIFIVTYKRHDVLNELIDNIFTSDFNEENLNQFSFSDLQRMNNNLNHHETDS